MTDDGRYLSRRERRAQEEREAARAQTDTDALALGPISESIPTHAPDGRLLSRRERRRLERTRQPMETWTAEEEMIATGQIPAMTPERIAEQEKLARERAAAAQQEAEAASAELEGLAGRPDVADPAPDAAPEQASAVPGSDGAPAPADSSTPASEQDSDQQAPERSSLIAAVAADATPGEPATPESPQQAPEDSAPVQPEPPAAVSFDSEPATPAQPEPAPNPAEPASFATIDPAPSAPEPDEPASATPPPTAPEAEPAEPTSFEPEPAAVDPEPAPAPAEPAPSVQSVPEPAAVDPEPAPAAPEPTTESPAEAAPSAPAAIPGMPPGMSPEMFAELFPPGSLQRRMIEDQAASEAAAQAEPEQEDPAAEIRRLTQEAVAGIDAASVRTSGEPAPYTEVDLQPADTAQDEPEPQPSSAAPSPIQPIPSFDTEQAPDQQQQPSWDISGPTSQPDPDQFSQQSSPSAPADELDSSPPTFGIPTFGAHDDPEGTSQASETEPHASSPEQPWREEPEPSEAAPPPFEQAPFDEIIGGHARTAALDEASGAAGAYSATSFGEVGADTAPDSEQVPQEVHGFAPATERSSEPWDEHPLSQVDREAPELPEMPPAQGVPQPDLSSIGMRANAGEQSPLPDVEPVPTGQIEVPPRERPELTGADVPRHFKWAHLAVFGAVALLLGVVVYHMTA